MKTVAIVRNPNRVPDGVPCVFRVGDPVVEGGLVVRRILYCRDGYANGPGKDPVFVVKYDGVVEINQIPASEIVDVTVDPEDKPQKTPKPAEAEAAVELPE